MPNKSSDEQSEAPLDERDTQSFVQIDLTPEFQRNLRDLAKRCRNIRFDVQTIVQDLEVGNFVGDRLAGVSKGYVLFKVRVRNRDIQKGKSAGYRLIYLVESSVSVLLLAIYSKSDREDIDVKEILQILSEFYETN